MPAFLTCLPPDQAGFKVKNKANWHDEGVEVTHRGIMLPPAQDGQETAHAHGSGGRRERGRGEGCDGRPAHGSRRPEADGAGGGLSVTVTRGKLQCKKEGDEGSVKGMRMCM